MKTFSLAIFLGAALLYGNTWAQQGAAPAPAADAMARVAIPAASARKVVLVMSGPKAVVEARDWASFKEEWRATSSDYAKESNIAFSARDTEPPAAGEPGTLVSVYVNDYRMMGIGARIFFGIMTGNAYIDAKVTYIDLATGKAFGTQDFNTSSSAGQGVFGKMTPQQVDTISFDIFKELKAAR